MRYLGQRQEKVNYPAFRAAGLDIGSGPTESMCKSLSRIMKVIGMRWTACNAESVCGDEVPAPMQPVVRLVVHPARRLKN